MNRICGRHLPFLLCIALLLTLCGCQKKPLDHPPFDEEGAAYLESLYGMAPEEVLAELGLSEEDHDELTLSGLVRVHKPITVGGKKFTKEFGFSYNDSELAKFTGIRYRCICEGAEEVGEVAEAVYLALVEQYGEIKGHVFGNECLCGEGVFDEVRKGSEGLRKYQNNTWTEAWCVGELSYVKMIVSVWNEPERFVIELEYWPLPEEIHRIDPDFEFRLPFGGRLVYGPYLRGEVPGNEYHGPIGFF